jgi:hypothetical protein
MIHVMEKRQRETLGYMAPRKVKVFSMGSKVFTPIGDPVINLLSMPFFFSFFFFDRMMSCERKLSYSRKEPIRQRNPLGKRVLFG